MRHIFLFMIAAVTSISAFAQYSGDISVTSAQTTFLGENAGDLAGHHVTILADINNDGYDELLVSAPLWDVSDQSTSHGRVYLFYGKSQGWAGTLSLADADARFYGTYALNEAAHDAFGIGDIDNDGYNDFAIAIKKTQAPQGGTRLGKVYIFFGKPSKLNGDISLEDADASLVGNAAGAEASHVMGVGDLDGDGYDDFIIGAGFHPQVGAEAGKVYLFFGKPRGQWAKNTNMETTSDASLLAENAGDWAGHRVSGLGDVNGDGYTDFLVGANHRNAEVTRAGAVYLILGKPRGQWGKDVSLSQADASWLGETSNQNLGWNVARVGDVDGDGLDDILFANNASTYYLILAKNLTLNKDMPISTVGATVFGHSVKVNDGIGHDISGLGDINFDGYDDFLIGNSQVNDPVAGTASGKSYLFMGRAQWPNSVAMSSADAIFIGAAANDESGFSVSGGDVNGDGVNDLMISAYKNDQSAADAGAAFLFLTPLNKLTLLYPNGGETLVGGQSATIRWTSDTNVDFVTIDLSTDNGGTWQPIAENITDSGSYPWTIPFVSSTQCLVRVKDAADGDPKDVSNGVFTITSDIRVAVIAPNGGETLHAGSTFPIRWSSLNLVGKVKIDYSIDGGMTFDFIAETDNTGSYDWLVPDRSSNTCLVRIVNASAKQPVDQSDRPFAITGNEYEITRIEAEDATLSAGYVIETRDETSGGKIARLTSSYASGEVTIVSTLPTDEYQIFVRYLDENDGVSSSIVQINGVPVKSWRWNAIEQSDTWVYFFAGRKKLNPGDVLELQNQRDNGEYCRIDYFEFRRTPPPPESLTLMAPNGGERWLTGSQYAIRWTREGGSGKVDIELSRNNGGSWELIADDVADSGVFSWPVTPPASEQCLIRITDSDGSPSDQSDAPFAIETPPTPKVTVTTPNGGERWQIGTSYAITWTSEHAGSTVAVHLSRNNGATWQSLADSAPNSGTFNYTADAPASDSCIVKVTDISSAVADSSDAVFTIFEQPQPAITIVRPNGGELWEIGSQQEIIWTSQHITGNVRIELSRDAGATWSSLTDDALNNGSITWLVSGPESYQSLIRIAAQESGVSDISDAVFEIVPPPSLTLVSPNGGELWLIGTVKEIIWASKRIQGPAKIELSRDGGDSWEIIVESTENSGAFPWTVSGPASNRCLIRVSAGALGDISDEKFEIKAPQQPQLTVTSPNGGELWLIGAEAQITWSSFQIDGPTKIELSRDGGDSWEIIVESTENSGAFPWTVSGPASNRCLIRVSAGALGDISDGQFEIKAPQQPQLTVTSPNGGELWLIGAEAQITWSSFQIDGPTKIELSRDGGDSWEIIVESTENSGAFPWTVSGPASNRCLIRVSAGALGDISDGQFEIKTPQQPQLTVTSPNGGELWEIGFPREIRWSSQLVNGPVKIEVSRDNGAGYSVIDADVENNGAYLWVVDGPSAAACLIRISAADGSATDVSDAAFGIIETPKLTVISPNGGEKWQIGSTALITWSSVSTSGMVKLQLSRDNGASWATLADSTDDDGAFDWTVEGPTSPSCLMLILDVDGFPIDISDSDFTIEEPTGITRLAASPTEFALIQNYPNPFNPETRIEYQLPRDAQISVEIYNLQGTRIRTLVSGFQPAGAYLATWNGRDDSGQPVPSGLYFYRMTADDFQETRRMLLAK